MNDVAVVIPGPRAHLLGTRRLLARFAALSGATLDPSLVALLGAPEALPESVPPEQQGLKYDAYLSPGPSGVAWGVAIGDRWEGEVFRRRAAAWVAALPVRYRLDAGLAFGAALAGASPAFTLAVGYDAPGRPPRVKLYFQEERWLAGVCTAGELQALLPRLAPGCVLPAWVAADRAVGVVTVELLGDGGLGVKAYLGGPTATACADGGPPEALALAATLDTASPAPGGWSYLTIRMRPDEPTRYSANKIYNHVQVGFTRGGEGIPAAWADVGGLFAVAGQAATLARLRADLAGIAGLRVVPTASALDAGGRQADVYCGAWVVGGGDRGLAGSR